MRMGAKYNHVIMTIEESKDIITLTLNGLTGSLQAYEACLINQADQVQEKMLHVRGEPSTTKEQAPTKVCGRDSFKGIGCGRGR